MCSYTLMWDSAQYSNKQINKWWGATILYLPVFFQSQVMPQRKKCNSSDSTTSSSKKRKATNSLPKNNPTYCTTCARACTREDANEPLMKSVNILVLIQEVVSVLAIQGVAKLLGNSSTVKRATCLGPCLKTGHYKYVWITVHKA